MATVIKVVPKVQYITEIEPGEYVPKPQYDEVVQYNAKLADDVSSMKEYNKLREEYIRELKFDLESLRADLQAAEDRLFKITELATEQRVG